MWCERIGSRIRKIDVGNVGLGWENVEGIAFIV